MSTLHRRPGRLGAPLLALILLAGCSTAGSPGGRETPADPATSSSQQTSAERSTTEPGTTEPEAGPGDLPPGESRPPITVPWPADEHGGLRAPGRSLAPRDAGEPLWHHIDRTPKPPARSRSAYPGGTTIDMDDNDVMTQHGPDGSSDMWLPGGEHVHTGPDGDYIENKGEGTLDSWDDDGSHTHIGPDGMYVDNPDGSRTAFDPDDGSTTDFPPLTPPGPAGKEPSGAVGEPHFLTEDGADITSQVLGEVQLATGVPGQAIQARVQPYRDSAEAAAITALAFGVGDSQVSVYLDGRVIANGGPAPDGENLQGDLPGGGAVGVWRDAAGRVETLIVMWPDLSIATVQVHQYFMDLRLQWRHDGGGRTGLLGSDDGDPANDFTGRDGAVADQHDQQQVDALVRSWRIKADDSLFEYRPGESAEGFAIDGFPSKAVPQPDQDSVPECAEVPTEFARAACAFDLTVTGDAAFVESSAAFGRAIAGDAARRGVLDYLGTRLAALTGGGTKITLDDADRASAQPAEAQGGLTAELAAGDSRTYRVEISGGSGFGAFNNDLTCPDQPWTGGGGYALFGDDGTVISGPRQPCDDLPRADGLPAGTYYLKLSGPGSFDLSLQEYPG